MNSIKIQQQLKTTISVSTKIALNLHWNPLFKKCVYLQFEILLLHNTFQLHIISKINIDCFFYQFAVFCQLDSSLHRYYQTSPRLDMSLHCRFCMNTDILLVKKLFLLFIHCRINLH